MPCVSAVLFSREIISFGIINAANLTYVNCCILGSTVVPAMGDPRREQSPAGYGHVVSVPTHLPVTFPKTGGHLPDANSHLLVVRTYYNGQCKQMPRFRWSFQIKIAGAHPKLRWPARSNFHAAIWYPQAKFHIESKCLRDQPRHCGKSAPRFTTSRRKKHAFCVQPAMSKKRTILSFHL